MNAGIVAEGAEAVRDRSARSETIAAWRADTLQALMLLALAAEVPVLLAAFHPLGSEPPPWLRWICGGLYGLATLAALVRRLPIRIRGWIWFMTQYGVAAVGLVRGDMVGSGRMLLVSLPVFALLLLGRASGWTAAGVSVVLYGGFATAARAGVLDGLLFMGHGPALASFWLTQALGLVMCLLPLVPLVDWVVRFQERTIASALESAAGVRRQAEQCRLAKDTLEREVNARAALQSEILEVAERERAHLANELHDGVCQQLSGALLCCRVAQRRLTERGAPVAYPLTLVANMIDEALGQAHGLAQGLAGHGVTSETLGEALRALARRVRETAEVECEANVRDELEVPDERATQILRIAQEGVTNALKHAEASHISIGLERSDRGGRLEIADDGVGLAEEARQGDGMGFRIMSHRAASLGGSLRAERRPGGGTRIICEFPLADADPERS